MLEIRGLRVAYGGIVAVKGVDLEVGAGELACVIGANGAGKTTMLKAIAGLLPRAAGSIRLQGEDTAGLAAHELASRGLALVPEGRGIFGRLTVIENLEMGAYLQERAAARRSLERVLALMPRLAERRSQTGGTLSGGEQQMLAIGRALMSLPVLLLVEEPSQGLAPVVVDRVYDALRTIADGRTGQPPVAVVVAEQFQQVHEDVSDRILVIDKGTVVADDELAGK